MHATAHSNVARSEMAATTPITIVRFPPPLLPKRVRRRCPATILAARRTVKAKGRTNKLTVSIRTISGIKALGVPSGTRCAKLWFNCFRILNTILPSQRGRARAAVNLRWLEGVNTYGNSPIKFINTIVKKIERGASRVPGAIKLIAAEISLMR